VNSEPLNSGLKNLTSRN